MTFRLGGYEIRSVLTGRFRLDGGSMFGAVPKTLWEKVALPDERNRIRLATRSLLLRDGTRTILVDTGNGTKWSDKEFDIYGIDTSRTLADALTEQDLSVEDITDVVLTHLHFDHAGGATTRTSGGEVIPTFPNATYYLQRANLDHAIERNEREAASYLPENFRPLEEAGVLRLIDGEDELFDRFEVKVFNGHTTGLQCPMISDGARILFYCADLIPTAAHLPLPWIMGYDLRAYETLREKRHLYDRAIPEGWILFFEHDPEIAAATVTRDAKGRVGVKERIEL